MKIHVTLATRTEAAAPKSKYKDFGGEYGMRAGYSTDEGGYYYVFDKRLNYSYLAGPFRKYRDVYNKDVKVIVAKLRNLAKDLAAYKKTPAFTKGRTPMDIKEKKSVVDRTLKIIPAAIKFLLELSKR